MSVDLESQIRLIADAAFEETTAVDVDRRLVVAASPSADTVANKEKVMLKPASDESPSPSRKRVLAVAASVVVIIAGILAIALLRDDADQIPADQTVPSTSVDPTTPTTVASVDTEALAAVGERLMTALDNRDRDTVAELVVDDANPVTMLGVTTKSGLIDLIDYLEAADLTFEVQECVGSEPDQVDCTIWQRSGFATAAGVGPGLARMLMKVEDGKVIGMRFGRAEGHGRAHDLFSRFIRESDPDAPLKMWWTDSSGEPWPELTDEAIELFEQYTQDYIEARS